MLCVPLSPLAVASSNERQYRTKQVAAAAASFLSNRALGGRVLGRIADVLHHLHLTAPAHSDGVRWFLKALFACSQREAREIRLWGCRVADPIRDQVLFAAQGSTRWAATVRSRTTYITRLCSLEAVRLLGSAIFAVGIFMFVSVSFLRSLSSLRPAS